MVLVAPSNHGAFRLSICRLLVFPTVNLHVGLSCMVWNRVSPIPSTRLTVRRERYIYIYIFICCSGFCSCSPSPIQSGSSPNLQRLSRLCSTKSQECCHCPLLAGHGTHRTSLPAFQDGDIFLRVSNNARCRCHRCRCPK